LLVPVDAAREPSNQVKIVQMRGNVQVCLDGGCRQAAPGEVLKVGDTVSTGVGGWVLLKMANKDTFELRERSRMLVDQISGNRSRFSVLLGRVKAKVHSSFFGRKSVSFATPAGVMAVRGTELMIDVGENGDTALDVLFGRVDFLSGETGKKEASFVQGEAGRMQAMQKPGEHTSGDGNASGQGVPGDAPGQGAGQQEAKHEEQKQEGQQPAQGGEEPKKEEPQGRREHAAGPGQEGIHEGSQAGHVAEKGGLTFDSYKEAFGGDQGFQDFSDSKEKNSEAVQHFTRNEAAAVTDAVNVMRENDMASGRTMRDVHGNLVRIEQRLFRPADNKVMFVNLIKRNDYQYKGFFDYKLPTSLAGPSGLRLDSFEAEVTFDRGLPGNIGDWPSFFADNGENLKVNAVKAVVTNGTDFFMAESRYDPGKDQVGGRVCGPGETFGVSCFAKTTVGFTNGTRLNTNETPDKRTEIVLGEWQVGKCDTSICGAVSVEQNIEGPDGDLWGQSETSFYVINELADTGAFLGPHAAGAPDLWFLAESYAIGIDGNKLNINSILDANITDPFAFMKTVAGEMIITAKTSSYNKATCGYGSGNTDCGTTFFRKGNIDLVIIPDLGVDLVQKFAAHLADSL
ncbi:MAG: FecR domain-containing protein, partial [Elusimicrobiota bacterium]